VEAPSRPPHPRSGAAQRNVGMLNRPDRPSETLHVELAWCRRKHRVKAQAEAGERSSQWGRTSRIGDVSLRRRVPARAAENIDRWIARGRGTCGPKFAESRASPWRGRSSVCTPRLLGNNFPTLRKLYVACARLRTQHVRQHDSAGPRRCGPRVSPLCTGSRGEGSPRSGRKFKLGVGGGPSEAAGNRGYALACFLSYPLLPHSHALCPSPAFPTRTRSLLRPRTQVSLRRPNTP
jgi:hypothetical protein